MVKNLDGGALCLIKLRVCIYFIFKHSRTSPSHFMAHVKDIFLC